MQGGISRSVIAALLAASSAFPQDVAIDAGQVDHPSRVEREEDFTVSGRVSNLGDAPLENVVVRYFLGGIPVLDDFVIESIPAGESVVFEAPLRLPDDGVWVFEVVADPEDAIPEGNEENNSVTVEISVGRAPAAGEPETEREPLPPADVPEVEEEEPPLPEGWETGVRTRSEARHYEVGGVRERSSLEEGWRFEENTDVRVRRQWAEEEYFQADASGRWTDERRADPEPWSLKRTTLLLENPAYFGEAGDTSPNFSRYTLGGGLRGAHVGLRLGEERDWEITGVTGTNKPRWEMHWQNQPGEPPDRVTSGLRVARNFTEDTTVGLQYVHSRDVTAGLRGSDTSARLESDVASADWAWAITDWLTAEGELAWASGDEDRRFDEDRRSAWAVRGDLSARWETVSGSLAYERVHPNFVTGAGSASTDRETWSGRFGWQALEWLDLGYAIRGHRDNLDHNRTRTTHSLEHIVDVGFNGPPVAPDLRAGIFWSGLSRDTSGTTRLFTSTIRPFVEHPIGPFEASAEYEFRETFEYRAGTGDDQSDTWRLGLSVPLELGGDWRLLPAVGFRYERFHDRDADTTDRARFVELSAMLEMPWNLEFEAVTSWLANDRDAADAGSDNSNYRFALTWTPLDNLRASAEFDRRVNEFEAPASDYDENTLGLAVEWDF